MTEWEPNSGFLKHPVFPQIAAAVRQFGPHLQMVALGFNVWKIVKQWVAEPEFGRMKTRSLSNGEGSRVPVKHCLFGF